jgi:RHS repeat-associated protein
MSLTPISRTQTEAGKEQSGTGASGQPLVSAPTISLPKGGGAIRGMGEKFAANPVTGTGSLSVPLVMPAGRSGFGPQLSLSYDSGAGNGPFGFGWSLAVPSITRKTDKGLPRYNDAEESDVFILSGAEDLVPLLLEDNGPWQRHSDARTVEDDDYRIEGYRPRIEGLFARIERWTNRKTGVIHWRSITRDNVTTIYGKNNNSRIFDPADSDSEHPKRIFGWLICESYDDKGNAIVYEYEAENIAGVDLSQAHERNRVASNLSANRYLKRVKYGNRISRLVQPDLAQAGWMFEVVFDYGEHDPLDPKTGDANGWLCRHDPFSTYRSGFEVRTYRLCQRVLMFHHFPDEQEVGQDCLVRSMDLVYRNIRDNPDDLRKGNPVASFIASITQCGYKRKAAGYLKRSLPPLEFDYTEANVVEEIRELDLESIENLPYGLDGARYQWIDLDGEGLPGILTEQAEGWFYKRNLSPLNIQYGVQTAVARLAATELVTEQPSLANISTGRQQLLDLAGDGKIDLVQFERPLSGYYERTQDGSWSQFVPFEAVPTIAWDDPNLKFVDLTGDGHADIIITEHNIFTWYPSLAEAGFGAAERVQQALDEEKGPHLVLADSVQSIYLADMSGDGLTDLVRVRNGEVCYWPNLGYGRFGTKVTMDNAPWFDFPDLFDQKQIRLGDIDGSGVTDILYLTSDGVQVYFNQSGNSWSEARKLDIFPQIDNLSAVMAIDLLGNGTACLVWSSALLDHARRPMRYIDLMGGQKPHLLVGMKNNLGSETRVHYAPSTKFYLEDKFADKPWATKLPFPVHVVERVETIDHISRNRFVTRYAYHHGYFDGGEREFRGFGMVEQWDTEEFATLSASGSLSDATNIDPVSHVPPALTRTWFHTGAWIEGESLYQQFARDYYREGDSSMGEAGLSDEQLKAMLLDDTVLPEYIKLPDGSRIPWMTSAEEAKQASRALKGSILRQEIYALDGTEEMDRPYSVSERNHTIEMLQPREGYKHAVFFAHPRETIDFHYERKLFDVDGFKRADPRVTHSMILDVDGFGNVLQSASIGYGRRHDDPSLGEDGQKQKRTLITYTENQYTDPVQEEDAYRAPLSCETRTYQLYNVAPNANQQNVTNLFRFDEMAGKAEAAGDGDHDIDYENFSAEGAIPDEPCRRLIERTRMLYRANDLSSALELGELDSRALPFESYKLAFTPGLLSSVYQRAQENLLPDPATVLHDDGGYLDLDGDGYWWIPSGRSFFHPNPNATPAQELDYAKSHFFLPHRFQDVFLNNSFVSYDKDSNGLEYDLLVSATLDAVGNQVIATHDYRVLQPHLVTDPNGNRSAAAFDALGMVVGNALMGKAGENLGDSLAGFEPDLDEAAMIAHLENPLANPEEILNQASTRLVYDIHQFERTSASGNPQPNVLYLLARETHHSDLLPGALTRILHSFSYSDGFGREVQKKIQAEPGPITSGGPAISPRWVGSGWKIFNNKGKQVRRYEPFFSSTHQFEFAKVVGVSPIFFYDPIERIVATLNPNHTCEKMVFNPWQQYSWDVNDMVLQSDPKNDPDVGDFFRRLADAEYLPTWHTQRLSGALGAEEQSAAIKAAVHANTPVLAYFDTLGRTFLTVAHNRFEKNQNNTTIIIDEKYSTRAEIDIEGNQREVSDANPITGQERIVMRYDYDMLGNRIHQASMEAGERWMVTNAVGKPIRVWDSRGHTFRAEYDQLLRPSHSHVKGVDPQDANNEILYERMLYGDGQDGGLTDSEKLQANLLGRLYKHYDGAGVATNIAYDFKGNPLRSSRQLAGDYKTIPNWSTNPALETEVFVTSSRFDALNRPVQFVAPHDENGSTTDVIQASFNEAGLLETIDVWLKQAGEPDQLLDSATADLFVVQDIGYNARGQREFVEYGNGVTTTYEYDPLTFRLVRLFTTRSADFPDDCPNPGDPPCGVQNLHYTYDPVGNITCIRDDAQQTIYFRNQLVEPRAEYTYDAIYRLIEATGREHLGQGATGDILPPAPASYSDAPRTGLLHPGDGNAVGRYIQRYVYDQAGNILEMIHKGSDPANPGWTRAYTYNETSLLETGKASNRLTSTQIGNDPPETHTYDPHGNLTAIPHLSLMQWDFQDRFQASSQQVVMNGGTPETTYYVYDANGQRARKVTERQAPAGQTPTRKAERIYFRGFEIYREYNGNGNTVTLERETMHVTDENKRIALIETRTQGSDGSPTVLVRYQFSNHLGSASLELDDNAQIISYEEYYPYGSTSYQAVRSQTETPKRYRYIGKERDEESGFYYHEARYYACHLGRWISTDPSGLDGGPNLYAYARNNPVIMIDSNGKEPQKVETYYQVTIPAVLKATRDTGLPIKNAMLLLIWARVEQSKVNPEEHGGRLLNAQPLDAEVASLCPNYTEKSCKVGKEDPSLPDYNRASITNLKDQPLSRGRKGASAHFGDSDTYSMLVFTLKRIAGEQLDKNIPAPPYGTINRKLRDPKMSPDAFFNSDLDVWTNEAGYGESALKKVPLPEGKEWPSIATTTTNEVFRAVPRLIQMNEAKIKVKEEQIGGIIKKIEALAELSKSVPEQGIPKEEAAKLFATNESAIQGLSNEIANIRKGIVALQQENHLLREFQEKFSPKPKK